MLVFNPAEDAFHLGHEAHVRHLVGFIENDDANFVEVQGTAVEQVVETPRRRDDDIHTGAEDVRLSIQ